MEFCPIKTSLAGGSNSQYGRGSAQLSEGRVLRVPNFLRDQGLVELVLPTMSSYIAITKTAELAVNLLAWGPLLGQEMRE